MTEVRKICLEVQDHIPDILEDWDDLSRERLWLALPREARLDHLPELVRALVASCVCADGDVDARTRTVRTAMEHGRQRNEQGFDDGLLFREYHLLRESLWRGMRRRHEQDQNAFDAIARVDAAITVCTRGSLEGFHGRHDDEEVVRGLVEAGPWPRF